MEFSLFCAIITTRESGRGTSMKTFWTEFDNVRKWLYRLAQVCFFLHPINMSLESKKKKHLYSYVDSKIHGKYHNNLNIKTRTTKLLKNDVNYTRQNC